MEKAYTQNPRLSQAQTRSRARRRAFKCYHNHLNHTCGVCCAAFVFLVPEPYTTERIDCLTERKPKRIKLSCAFRFKSSIHAYHMPGLMKAVGEWSSLPQCPREIIEKNLHQDGTRNPEMCVRGKNRPYEAVDWADPFATIPPRPGTNTNHELLNSSTI